MNIKSVSKNYDQLIVYLSCLKHKFSVIALSETWTCKNKQSLFPILRYNCIFKNLISSRCGGVALYVLDHITFHECLDLNTHGNNNFECVFIQLNDVRFGKKIVGLVYYPPDSNLELISKGFDYVLKSSLKTKVDYIIAGDYNIDHLKHTAHEGTSSFVNNLYTHSGHYSTH